MVYISRLSVQNIRCHEFFEVSFAPSVSVITGLNGSGKTSLLEAVFTALQGSSFKGSDADLLRKESPWWRIELLADDIERNVTFDPNLDSGRKKFTINNKVNYRLPQKYKHPVVLFEPEDLRLLHGSPARRRLFIDRFIAQLDIFYSQALHKYERALRQRNGLLKINPNNLNELFAWDVTLSEYGAYIIDRRIAFIEQINQKLSEAYSQIAKNQDSIMVHYSQTYIGDIKQKLLNDLNSHHQKDQLLGYTSVGPHRHDVIFDFNNSPALNVASRGEVRCIILALKFLEVEIIEHLTDKKPIILLDDVFSELDTERQKRLLLAKNQAIITSAHIPSGIKDYRLIKL